jgi:ABC-type multidrug transport system ATPase subunit
VRSGHAVVPMPAVLAAGLGTRRSGQLRSASFRLDDPADGRAALGILTGRAGQAGPLVDLIAGRAVAGYGELRVLGEDLTTEHGRERVRSRVGVARPGGGPQLAFRIRGLVEHAARLALPPGTDRQVLAAAVIDRLSLTPWAEVPLRSAPLAIARRARLAAAAVHQPELLLLDELLDDLPARDIPAMADGISELSRDAAILITGSDASALNLACEQVLRLAEGILVGPQTLVSLDGQSRLVAEVS